MYPNAVRLYGMAKIIIKKTVLQIATTESVDQAAQMYSVNITWESRYC